MKRIFWNLLFALLAGACLRLLFVLKFPAGSGDTVIYEQLATNWLRHGMLAMDINGAPSPVDLRMPGYPAFLAAIYALTGKVGEDARRAVMLAQIAVDLIGCVIIGALAAIVAGFCGAEWRRNRVRVFVAALWLAALCPFTGNYPAVPLTEVWATFFTALALCAVVLLAVEVGTGSALEGDGFRWLPQWLRGEWQLAGATGLVVGLATLFRPEAPLLLITTALALCWRMARRGQWARSVVLLVVLGAACAVPLVPWTVRNAMTLREFQPLAPKDTMLPGEVDPKGFMAWESTWLYRVRDCYLVPWKLNDEAIRIEDIPAYAFDSSEEKARVAALLDAYNDELTWNAQEDAAIGQIARERTERYPLRRYLWVPLRRVFTIWFTPRIELVPVSGHVFPLRQMYYEDRVDQRTTVSYFFLNIFYVALALWGGWKLWRGCSAARPAIVVMVLYAVVRTAFLTTLETPEPRYVLVCFPVLFALGAQAFVSRATRGESANSLFAVGR
jgi:hypothetical protein